MWQHVARLLKFLNPVSRLGQRNYSFIFPAFLTLLNCVIFEIIIYYVVKNPVDVGIYLIFASLALIIYFSSRDGTKGGSVSATIILAYYVFFIYFHHYSREQVETSIPTIEVLGIIFYLLVIILGGLKIKVDKLIEEEAIQKRRLQIIIQQLPAGIVFTNSKGIVTEQNKQIEKILGHSIPIGSLLGRDYLARFKVNGKYISPSKSPMLKTLSTGKAISGREYTLDRDDGKKVHVHVDTAPVHNAAGKVFAATAIITDITAQKEMEERKDDFVNMASHELKTPITSMKLYVDSLLKQMKMHNDKTAVKKLKNIQYQTERLQELVNNLLDVSRLQTKKLNFNKESINLNDLISESVEELREITRGRKITLTNTGRIYVFADKLRLYQVLSNLITNAIKYSPENSTISVNIKKDGNYAIISVKDNGIGIKKDQLTKIFDKLYQVTDYKEKTFPGLGMGLYISKEIIRKHGGKMWAESAIGNGSVFHFTLPLKDLKRVE